MRLKSPRIPPVKIEEASDDQREFLAPYQTPTGILNIYATMANNTKAARAFHTWGGYVLRQSTLNQRWKETVILRVGWLCKSGYEWTQHSRLARREGLTDADIERIKAGPNAAGWSAEERTLLQAADELHNGYFITDATWAALGGFLSDEERMNLVFVVGQYHSVCMILNTFGIQVEEGVAMDESLRV